MKIIADVQSHPAG